MADAATFLRSALLPSALVKVVFALCGAILALTAALAVTCFVKAYAMSFLGIRRGTWKLKLTDLARKQRISLTFLATACILLGILPTYSSPPWIARSNPSLARAPPPP